MKTKRNLLGAAATIVAAAMLTIPATALAQDPVGKSRTPSKRAPKVSKPAKKAPATKKRAPSEEAPEVYHAPEDEGGEVVEAPPPDVPAADEEAPEQTEPAEAEEGRDEAPTREAKPVKPRGNASDADWSAAEEGIVLKKKDKSSKKPASTDKHEDDDEEPARATSVVPPYMIGPAGPDELEWSEGMAIPPGYVKGTKVRKGLVIGGAITFGASWLLSIAAATALIDEEERKSTYSYDERNGDGSYTRTRYHDDDDDIPDAAPLYIPLAGPFIAIHTMDAKNEQAAALAFDGAVQLAGFTMFVAGLAAKKTILVRDRKVDVAVAPGPGSLMFQAKF